MQKTILSLNIFSTHVLSFCHLQNISNFSHRLSLLPLISVFQFSPKSFLSLSPTSRVRRQDCAPSPVENGPHLVGKIQTQVLFLSHTSPLSSHRFCSTPAKSAPSPVPKKPGFYLVGKPPNPKVFTLSLPHSFSHLTNSLCCHLQGWLGTSQFEFRVRVWVERPSQGPNSLAYAEEFLKVKTPNFSLSMLQDIIKMCLLYKALISFSHFPHTIRNFGMFT
jgi:hypothetical protein